MKNRVNAFLMVAALVCLVPTVSFALMPYSTNFENYALPSPGALMGDGWLVFGNIFDLGGGYITGYGPFDAPNDGAAFCAIATGEGGPAQGQLQLSVYADYNHPDMNNIILESNVFQEQIIGPGDIGETWVFDFDAKLGNLEAPTTAVAFIKILNPADWSVIFIPLDMTATPATWNSYSMSVLIDPTFDGRFLQIGFANTTTAYAPSGVFYDNINFYPTGAIATEDRSFGDVKSLFR